MMTAPMPAMRYPLTLLAAFLTLVCSGCAAPGSLGQGSGTGVWIGPTASARYGTYQDWDDDLWPAYPGYGRSLRHRPAVACDSFGRCWQLEPADPFERLYARRPHARPPGWAENLPRSARMHDRFLRPGSDVVCDRASRLCYKDGNIDKSDTQSVFGDRAGDRADRLRDRLGTGDMFVPERGVACDRERRLCLEDGDPDRKLTRRYFGKDAARALAEERGGGDGGKGKRRNKRKKG
jgi:Fels-1 Prophage Protein-like